MVHVSCLSMINLVEVLSDLQCEGSVNTFVIFVVLVTGIYVKLSLDVTNWLCIQDV
jgi:hypothetical protein